MNNLCRCLSITAGLLFVNAFLLTGSIEAQPNANLFDRADKNKDGKLTRDELPEQVRRFFDQMDLDKNGSISREEDAQIRQRLQQRRNQNQAQQQPRLPEGTVAHRNIPYVENGGPRQQLDVYVPAKAEGKLPLVVWIHGGGWQNGSKERTQALYLLEHGYVVASINYRLTDLGSFPAQIHDCKAAIRFLKQQADQYHIDASRVGVWGSSAGGHLVALVGTSGDAAELEGELGPLDQNSLVQAVCDYYGPTDFTQMDAQAKGKGSIRHDNPNSPEAKLLGGPVQEKKDVAKAASPITYVTKNDPPFLIVHGDEDPLVPVGQSEILQQKLVEAGVDSTLHVVKGGKHGPFNSPEQHEAVRKFFDRVLKAERE